MLLFLLGPLRGWATPSTRPEDAMLALFKAGEVEAARQGFSELLEKEFSAVESGWGTPIDSVRDLRGLWWRLPGVRVEIYSWERAEVVVRLAEEQPTPPEVLRAIAGAAIRLATNTLMLQSSAAQVLGPEDQDTRDSVEADAGHVGKLLLKTVIFLRGTPLTEERHQVFQLARVFAEVPESLEEFDAQDPDPDLRIRFGIPPPKDRSTTPPKVWVVEDDDPIALFARRAYEGLFSGDLALITPYCVDSDSVHQQVQRAIEARSGIQLRKIGRMTARDIGNDELEVSFGVVEIQLPDGAIRRSDFALILRRFGRDDYRISYVGSDSARRYHASGVR
jgi:hypothetical protein